MTTAREATGPRALGRHVAVRALLNSVLINMIAPAVFYRLSAPHFAADSLAPLALSGAPPILWLTYGLVRLKAIDFLGLFAAENVVVGMAALLLAHTERQALIGRSMQNVVLAGLFLGSLALARPMVFHMARQLMTGNDPQQREAFDRKAERPGAIGVYRALTMGWTLALLVKAAGGYVLAAHFHAKDYLLLSPLWDLVSDSALLTWTLLYGRSKLGVLASVGPVSGPAAT